MTRQPHPVSKVLLITDSRESTPGSAGKPIRRFRLARLRLDGRQTQADARYEHLKRTFD